MENNTIFIVSEEIPPDFSGAGLRAYNHAKLLLENNYNVIIVSTTKVILNNRIKIKTIFIPKYYYHSTTIGKLFRLFYTPVLFIKLFIYYFKKRNILVHSFSSDSWFQLLNILVAKIFRNKVITGTTLYLSDDPISIRKKTLGFIKFKIFLLADSIINISPLLYSTCYKMKIKKPYFLIPNPVNVNKFCQVNKVKKDDLRLKLHLEENKFILIYVGILDERKNVFKLVEMFNNLKKTINNAQLILVGPTNKNHSNINTTKRIENYIFQNNITKDVKLTGLVENVEEWLQASDVFVFASKREGFGNVYIEAMSVGLPIVSINIPKITDYIIENQKDGVIVYDFNSMQKEIIKLYKNHNFYSFIKNNAINKVHNNFSENIILKKYLEVYEKILRK